ncbi:MAG: Rrf2 family transcriptional regulator [Piscirickettsiaceae bacterium]|jgi:Rrf2 family transcriptional regulator, iron-sulfur cluster assembly transcription factor|nr:Rrf2 family transcriptional regulator [Piscirickettsiaceae bacterium]
MRLTTKGRYAVTAMLDLSLNYGIRPITLADISDRQGISLSYLEQLFANLRRQGLVSSSRGPGGGYRLSRSADEVTVLDVISAVDEKVDVTRCEGKGNCSNDGKCLSHEIWQSLSDQIRMYLGGITLGEVVKNHQKENSEEEVIKFEMMG